MCVDGIYPSLALHFGLFNGAQHQGYIRPVDIAVEQSDFMSHPAESDRQVDGERGFADTALAGTNGNDGINPGNGLRGRHLLARRMGMSAQRSPSRVRNTASSIIGDLADR